MEYKAVRNFTKNGVRYEKNQLVKVERDDEAKVLEQRNFIKKNKAVAKKKSVK